MYMGTESEARKRYQGNGSFSQQQSQSQDRRQDLFQDLDMIQGRDMLDVIVILIRQIQIS